ncbi:hypothetical protein TNCV_4068661 [Trichonephila clavipes]|nr:hypothetical protein TNCV_4068661 [Trichonephila clavipes]
MTPLFRQRNFTPLAIGYLYRRPLSSFWWVCNWKPLYPQQLATCIFDKRLLSIKYPIDYDSSEKKIIKQGSSSRLSLPLTTFADPPNH